MSFQTTVQGTDGPVPCTVFGDVSIENKKFLIIGIGVGAYSRGVFTRYLVVPPSMVQMEIPDKVEEVADSE